MNRIEQGQHLLKMIETWHDVKGYEGLYRVSDMGNVYSVRRGKLLKTPTNSQNRRTVTLYKNGKKHFSVYRLVAAAFLEGDGIVRHLNGDSLDDRLENLSYGTHKQNTHDRIAHGTMFYGEDVHNSKFSNSDIVHIRKVHTPNCTKYGTTALAKKYGVALSTISSIVHGRNWKTIN